MTILDLSATSLLSPQLDHSRSNKMSTPHLPSPSHTNKAEKNSIQLRRISIRQSESSVWLACAFHYQIWWLEYLGEETNSKLLPIRIRFPEFIRSKHRNGEPATVFTKNSYLADRQDRRCTTASLQSHQAFALPKHRKCPNS